MRYYNLGIRTSLLFSEACHLIEKGLYVKNTTKMCHSTAKQDDCISSCEVRHPLKGCLWYETKVHPIARLQFWSCEECDITPSLQLFPVLLSRRTPIYSNNSSKIFFKIALLILFFQTDYLYKSHELVHTF